MNCYSTADVSPGMGKASLCMNGGLLGVQQNSKNKIYISNCYFLGTSTKSANVHGAIVGKENVSNSSSWGTIQCTNCYSSSSSGIPVLSSIGLTTAQFADNSNFTDWDFDNTWIMKDGRPELRIFLTAEEIEELEEADNAANESQE